MIAYLYVIALAGLLMLFVVLISMGIGYLISTSLAVNAMADWIVLGFK